MSPSPIEFLKHIFDECVYLEKEYANNSFDEFAKKNGENVMMSSRQRRMRLHGSKW